jgi:uncharacterized protein YbjT (DUF2867 family)
MEILVTGVTGAIGSVLAPRLVAVGHGVRGLSRDPARAATAPPGVRMRRGDAFSGIGLDEALAGVDVAYYLIHSMEAQALDFAQRDRVAARTFREAARRAGVRRVVYLGGLVPPGRAVSPHLASRLEVEEILRATTPDSVALRASIVISATSRSFRFLVRLVERLPVMPLPAWRDFRTQPIDGRDVIAFLERCATAPQAAGRTLDLGGPDVLTYGDMVQRIAATMLLERPALRLGFSATALTSRVAAAVAGESHELVGPLMEGLEGDLLPRDDRAAALLDVRLHRFDAAVERALRDWEASGQRLAAR